MSLIGFYKYLVYALSGFLLSGCGFSPIYSNKTDFGQMLEHHIRIGSITGRNAYRIREGLTEFLSPSNKTLYLLDIKLSRNLISKGININDIASRRDYVLEARYFVYDQKKALIFDDRISTIASYSIPISPYGALAAYQDAEERAVEEMIENIRISLFKNFLDYQNTEHIKDINPQDKTEDSLKKIE